MDKYEQFRIEQSALLKALAEDGPSEPLARRMAALYKDVCVLIALGPTNALPHAPADEERELADEHDIAYYRKALDSGALTRIFAYRPWGEASLQYEALEVEGEFCPAIRVSWSNTLAFLAEGKEGAFNKRLDDMVGALARMLSARSYHWQVRLV